MHAPFYIVMNVLQKSRGDKRIMFFKDISRLSMIKFQDFDTNSYKLTGSSSIDLLFIYSVTHLHGLAKLVKVFLTLITVFDSHLLYELIDMSRHAR